MKIAGELHRRNVFKVAFAYLVVGWVVLQVAEFISPLLRLPEWTVSFALYIGIIGFPFALIFAWAFELTPDGLKRTQDVKPEESVTHETGANLNRVITGLLALAVLILLVDRFVPVSQDDQVASLATDSKAKSIAVLPFVNMSDDPQQEYFSDGISEELLNALAKIRELRVAARTSSFAFKGKNQDITDIGQQLNVETVLEGSVRKSGQRLRITAQLINVEDGYHLWSETYDRDLTDIFAIQDEISGAIVSALKVHLTGNEPTLEERSVDLDAYNFFLLARHNLRRRTESSLLLASKQYQQAIDIDPSYAEAWAGKALATELLSDAAYGSIPRLRAIREAQALLDRAFELDAELAAAHATQGLLYLDQDEPMLARKSLEQAIELAPSEGILHSWLSNAWSDLGNYNAYRAALEQGYKIDPLHPAIRHNLAVEYGTSGEIARARELVTPGTPMAYELETVIAGVQGLFADQFKAATRAIELSEDGVDNLLELRRSLTLFYRLKNIQLALQGTSDSNSIWMHATIDPEKFASDFQLAPGQENTFELSVLSTALARLGQCERLLEDLASQDIQGKALYGGLDAPFGQVAMAVNYAYCQQELGQSMEARALAERIRQYIDTAVANGQPPDYFLLLARVQMLLGEEDAAMGSIRLAWQNFKLDWTDLLYPELAPLKTRSEYLELTQSMQQHLNSERAKLGWEPIAL